MESRNRGHRKLIAIGQARVENGDDGRTPLLADLVDAVHDRCLERCPVSDWDAPLLAREKELHELSGLAMPQLRRLLVQKWLREGFMPIRTICFPDLGADSPTLLWDLRLTSVEWCFPEMQQTRSIGISDPDVPLTFALLWRELCRVRPKPGHRDLHVPGLCPFSRWRVPDRPFVTLFGDWLKEIRAWFFQAHFFRVLFLVLRAPPIDATLYLELNQLRRRISDVLIRDGLHEDLSLLRRFVVIFGGSFHVSRALFSGVCAHSLFRDVRKFQWRLPQIDDGVHAAVPPEPDFAADTDEGQQADDSRTERRSEPRRVSARTDFPRTLTIRSHTVEFIAKTQGTQGGIIIVWSTPPPSTPTVFFTKLHIGAVSHTPATKDIMASGFWEKLALWGGRVHGTQPASRHLSSMSLDLREVAIYVVLQALDLGPVVTFLIDLYSAGSFHIITKEILGAQFLEPGRAFGDNSFAYLQVALLAFIFCLRDLHVGNICLANGAVKLVDFEHPKWDSFTDARPIPTTLDELCLELGRSPAVGRDTVPGELVQEVWFTLSSKLQNLPEPELVFFLHPGVASEPPLGHLLSRAPPGPGSALSLDTFMVAAEDGLLARFFRPLDRHDEFDGRSPGELLGFSDPTASLDSQTLEAEVRPFACHPSSPGVPDFEVRDVEPHPTDGAGHPRASPRQAAAQLVWLRLMVLHRVQLMDQLFLAPVLEAISHDAVEHLAEGLPPNFTLPAGFCGPPLDTSPPLVCVAAYYGACRVMESLHAKNADFTAPDRAGYGVLFFATAGPSPTVPTFLRLKALGVSIAGCGPDLISAGHSDVVVNLLDQAAIAIDDHNADGSTLLHVAASKGDHPVVSQIFAMLHEPGADGPDYTRLKVGATKYTNALDSKHRTPLILAVQGQHESVVTLLLKFPGLLPLIQDDDNHNAYFYGGQTGNSAIQKALQSTVSKKF
jgi:hypothetical protein